MKKLEILQMENLQGGKLSCRTAGYLVNVGLFSALVGAEFVAGALVGIYGAYYLEHCY